MQYVSLSKKIHNKRILRKAINSWKLFINQKAKVDTQVINKVAATHSNKIKKWCLKTYLTDLGLSVPIEISYLSNSHSKP